MNLSRRTLVDDSIISAPATVFAFSVTI